MNSLSTRVSPFVACKSLGASYDRLQSKNHPSSAAQPRSLRAAFFTPSAQATSSGDEASPLKKLTAAGTAAAVAATLLCGSVSPDVAQAKGQSEVVAEFNASGLVFKDSIEIAAFPDPKVEGVMLYLSDFKRSLTAKLQKDFFSEPSTASLTCTRTGPISFIPEDIISKEGEEIFSERKNLSFSNKNLRVRRVYDEKNGALIYISYSTRLTSTDGEGQSNGRYRTSICSVQIADSLRDLAQTVE